MVSRVDLGLLWLSQVDSFSMLHLMLSSLENEKVYEGSQQVVHVCIEKDACRHQRGFCTDVLSRRNDRLRLSLDLILSFNTAR